MKSYYRSGMKQHIRPLSSKQSVDAIGEFVRRRRTANGMTQRELGNLAGTGTRIVSEIERGKPTLRMDAVNAVLSVFGKMLGCVDTPRRSERES